MAAEVAEAKPQFCDKMKQRTIMDHPSWNSAENDLFVLRVFERKSCGKSTCSTIWYPYCVKQILGPPARGQ